MISIVIPTYNRNDVLKYNILALINQGLDYNYYEVIVCDDGGDCDTQGMLKALKVPFRIKYYWHEKKGFRAAKARNEGVKLSTGEKIVFLDQDNILSPNALKEFSVLDLEKKYYVGVKKLVPLDFYMNKINDDVILNNFEVFESQFHGEIKATLSSFGLLSKFYFNKLEGYDEQFVGYGLEDSEFMSRLKDVGIRMINTNILSYHIAHPPHLQNKINLNNRILFQKKLKNKVIGKKVFI
jgi:glycosyltransferase involved in cell wall biosynthesis